GRKPEDVRSGNFRERPEMRPGGGPASRRGRVSDQGHGRSSGRHGPGQRRLDPGRRHRGADPESLKCSSQARQVADGGGHGMSHKLRVLVVDDSALMRKLIPQILARDSEIEVVGTAMDGEFGLKKIEELRPDVVTLDLEMPRMDGMETLRQITRRFRVPVIVVSALTTEGASATFKALAMGAFDFVAKPRDAASAHMDEIATDLIAKIKVAARSKIRPAPPTSVLLDRPRPHKPALRTRREPTKVAAIGISTGGPNALQYLLTQLPGDFPGTIVVVQHMPEGFTEMFS